MTRSLNWDMEEGEQTLKVLPNVINWFERVEEAVLGDDRDTPDSEEEDEDESHNINEEDYCIEDRKLSAIFHLLRLYMPLLF